MSNEKALCPECHAEIMLDPEKTVQRLTCSECGWFGHFVKTPAGLVEIDDSAEKARQYLRSILYRDLPDGIHVDYSKD
jgi:ribosomal protein S27AE